MNRIRLLFAIVIISGALTSCYRMPTEDDFCVVPATNNPSVTREKPQGPIPQLSY